MTRLLARSMRVVATSLRRVLIGIGAMVSASVTNVTSGICSATRWVVTAN